MQKIIPQGKIESHANAQQLPAVVLPEEKSVFSARATRFRQLASPNNVLSDYLILMAEINTIQDDILSNQHKRNIVGFSCETSNFTKNKSWLSSMQSRDWKLNANWLSIQDSILNTFIHQSNRFPKHVVNICKDLSILMRKDFNSFKKLVDVILSDDVSSPVDFPAAVPFVMAALQVYWTSVAVCLEINKILPLSRLKRCPICGYLPLASLVHVGGVKDNYRYLFCGICSTRWHNVRIKCIYCEGTNEISYHYIKKDDPAIKAETCDQCRAYSKIFYQEKDYNIDPIADDLASLPLDILMGEKGYSRFTKNPFF